MKTSALLKENIRVIIKLRGTNARSLARYVRQTNDPKVDSWMSKILKNPTREVPLKYWDRIADHLGVSVYQLLQPGHNSVTERRSALPRRSGKDRRLSRQTVTEKRGDVDIVDIIRALSDAGRAKVLGFAADVWNDELEGLRTRAGIPGVSDRMHEKRAPVGTRKAKRRGQRKATGTADDAT
jgi:hypothetical protein